MHKVVKKVASAYMAKKAKYYTIKGESIDEVSKRWIQGDKANDAKVHGHYRLSDVWPYREYTWTRDKSRAGMTEVNGKWVDLPGPEKWDAISDAMKKRGWEKNQPAIVAIGKNGGIKVIEGNHRLAIARELGVKDVPVQFDFRSTV